MKKMKKTSMMLTLLTMSQEINIHGDRVEDNDVNNDDDDDDDDDDDESMKDSMSLSSAALQPSVE